MDDVSSGVQLPAPFVPLEADLRDFLFMPLEIERLRRSKSWLIAKRKPEVGFFMLNLWMGAWHNLPAGSLEDDDDVLADMAVCDPKRWSKVKADVMRGWVKCSDGRLYHSVVAEKVRDAWERKRQQRERSRRGNEARWGNRNRLDNEDESGSGGLSKESGKNHDQDAAAILKGLPKGVQGRIPNDPKGQGQGQGERIESPPTPSQAEKRRGPNDPAAIVAKVFLDAREARWPDEARLPTARITLETIAQQHLDAGASVELLTEVIKTAIQDWKNPTPPNSLAALRNTIADRIASHRRAVEGGGHHAHERANDNRPFDPHEQARNRLRSYAKSGHWHSFWGPEPGHPMCQIPKSVIAKEIPDFGPEWKPRENRAASGG